MTGLGDTTLQTHATEQTDKSSHTVMCKAIPVYSSAREAVTSSGEMSRKEAFLVCSLEEVQEAWRGQEEGGDTHGGERCVCAARARALL